MSGQLRADQVVPFLRSALVSGERITPHDVDAIEAALAAPSTPEPSGSHLFNRALATIVSDSLAAATEGTDWAEASPFSDEPGSPYVMRLTNEIASRLRAAPSTEPALDVDALARAMFRRAVIARPTEAIRHSMGWYHNEAAAILALYARLAESR